MVGSGKSNEVYRSIMHDRRRNAREDRVPELKGPGSEWVSEMLKHEILELLLWVGFWYTMKLSELPRWLNGKKKKKKNLPANVGDSGLIPRLGRSPGEGNGNPLQYSSLGNPLDRGAWWAAVHGVTKSQTRLSDWACMYMKLGGQVGTEGSRDSWR